MNLRPEANEGAGGAGPEREEIEAAMLRDEALLIGQLTRHMMAGFPFDPGERARALLESAEVLPDPSSLGRGWCVSGGDGRHYLSGGAVWAEGLGEGSFYATVVEAQAVLVALRRAHEGLALKRAAYLGPLMDLEVGRGLDPGQSIRGLLRMVLEQHPQAPVIGRDEWVAKQVAVTVERLAYAMYRLMTSGGGGESPAGGEEPN